MFKTAVYASTDESFQKVAVGLRALGLAEDSICFADSRRFTRLDIINQNVGSWILFIDHDCVLQADVKDKIIQLLSAYQSQSGVVITGLYENPQAATQLQRAHNWIANTWLEMSYTNVAMSPAPLVLGGCFLVRSPSLVPGVLPQDMWGAEDKLLAKLLKQNQLKFYFHPEIRMKHDTSKSWMHFLRRAWLHGQNDMAYETKTSDRLRYSVWLRKIASADFDLVALILLHFCIQKTAMRVRRVLRTNKQ